MLNNVIPRYRATYRADEIDLILRFAKRGESLGFMGIAGVGKSNIVNYLRDIHQPGSRRKEDVAQLRFPLVDATQWQGTPDSLWKMMIDALGRSMPDTPQTPEDDNVIPFSEEERAFKTLQSQLQQLCQRQRNQVMFVLDDFDQVLEIGPLAMLEQLNGLRSEGNRGLLSYLIFTKRLPHILGRNHPLENNSKFYDLFRHNIYALEPYSRDDTLRMLQHLNELAGNPLPENQLEQIYKLSGGHARLTRLVFNIWIEEKASGIKSVFFAEQPDIKQECWRILENLHQEEQDVALRAAQGSHTDEDKDIINHLMQRGLLVKAEPVTWFSPLMEQFLKTYGK